MVGSVADIQQRYAALSPALNERGRRLFAAAEARAYGPGGVSAVSRITGMARSTIGRGVHEIAENKQADTERVRKPGAGRKSKLMKDSTLLRDIERLVEPVTRGDPMRPLRWTSKSLRHLSQALQAKGHSACPHVIADCLHELGYSLQANRKTREVSGHVDRNAQFEYLNDQATAFLAANEPVISVDTKALCINNCFIVVRWCSSSLRESHDGGFGWRRILHRRSSRPWGICFHPVRRAQ